MDKVEIQFDKLRLQGKINNAEKVEIDGVNNFKAKLCSPIIQYNKEMNKLLDDEISFMLLHEEGHFINPEKKFLCSLFVGFIIVIVLPILMYFRLGLSAFVLALLYIFTLLLFILLSYVSLKYIYQDFEYKADDYACKNTDNPLDIIALSYFPHISNVLNSIYFKAQKSNLLINLDRNIQ